MKLETPTLENAAVIRKYLGDNEYRSCDFCAGTLILWGEFFHYRYAVVQDTFVIAQEKDGKAVSFTFPEGAPDKIRPAVEEILTYFQENDLTACFMNVTEEIQAQLEEWYPGRFTTEYDRDNADYLYLTEKLATFSGRKLHSKKNHCNHFIQEYPDYTFEPITEENRRACFHLEDSWNDEIDESGDRTEEKKLEKEADYEEFAIAFALNHMEELGLTGGVLKAGGRVVAFTIGEPLTKDTYVVHFEKARADIQGAYPMICREYVSRVIQPGGYLYVNREEDMGVEGLRQSKLSYHPEMLYQKGIARENAPSDDGRA